MSSLPRRCHPKYNSGVPNMRKPLKKSKIEYKIYGIFYQEQKFNDMIATCAAESSEEALSFLEEALEDKGFKHVRGPLNAVVEDTGFKTEKKGIIYGYDSLSRKIL